MNLQAFLRYLSIGFLFLVPFVGLVVSDTGYFPFITGKNIAFRLIIDLAALSYGALLLYEMLSTTKGGNHVKYLPKRSWVLAAFGVFLLVLGLADIFGENFTKSFWSNFERMEGYVTFIHLGMYLLMLTVFLKTEIIWRRFFQTIILSSVVIGINALFRAKDIIQYQFVGRALQAGESFSAMLQQAGPAAVEAFNQRLSSYRLEGALGNSTYIGAFAMLAIFLCAFLIMRILRTMSAKHELGALDEANFEQVAEHAHKNKHVNHNNESFVMDEEKSKIGRISALVVYSLVIFFNFYILYHSGTRSAMLGLAVALAFAAAMLAIFEKQSKLLKRAGISVVIIMLVSVGGVFIAKDSSFVKENPLLSRFSKLFTTSPLALFQSEGRARTGIWNIAWQGFKERPILGWGQDNFNFVFNKYYNPALYDQEQWFDRAHDVFFDWMIAGGLLGILSYLSLYGVSIYAIWRRRDNPAFNFEEKVALTSLLIGYFIHNLFVFDSISSYIVFATFLGFVSYRDIRAEQDNQLEEQTHNGHIVKNAGALLPLFPAALIIVALLLMYGGVYISYASSQDLITAMQTPPSPTTGFKTSLDIFKTIVGRGPIGGAETREQLVSKAVQVLQSQVDNAQKTEWDAFVRSEYNKQISDSPRDARTYLFYASYLQSAGDTLNAEKNLKLAIQNSPSKQTMLYELGSLYLGRGVSLRHEATNLIDGASGKTKTPKEKESNIENSKLSFDQSLEQFKKAVDLYPLNPEAHQLYAIASAYADRLDITDSQIKALVDLPAVDIATRLAHYTAAVDERLLAAYIESGHTKDRVTQWLNNREGVALTYAENGDKETAIKLLEATAKVYPPGKITIDLIIAQINGSSTASSTLKTIK